MTSPREFESDRIFYRDDGSVSAFYHDHCAMPEARAAVLAGARHEHEAPEDWARRLARESHEHPLNWGWQTAEGRELALAVSAGRDGSGSINAFIDSGSDLDRGLAVRLGLWLKSNPVPPAPDYDPRVCPGCVAWVQDSATTDPKERIEYGVVDIDQATGLALVCLVVETGLWGESKPWIVPLRDLRSQPGNPKSSQAEVWRDRGHRLRAGEPAVAR